MNDFEISCWSSLSSSDTAAASAGTQSDTIHIALELSLKTRVVVNDPASLELPRRSRVRKTDRIDVRRRVRALKAWNPGDRDTRSAVRIPAVEEEDRRRRLRERGAVVKQGRLAPTGSWAGCACRGLATCTRGRRVS